MTGQMLFWCSWSVGLLAWLPAGARLRGLTAHGAWVWAGVAWATLGVVHWLVGAGDGAEPATFAAACGAFCPVVSLLGAKRPQDRAWHFVVLSLWGVLALPAAESWALNPGQELEIHAARGWFLLALVLVSAAQWLPTRHWLSALLLTAGQTWLLSDYLPLVSAARDWQKGGWQMGGWQMGGGAACLAAAMLTAWIPAKRRRGLGWNRLWLEFRDLYGVMWSLRVMQRINDVAAASQWGVRLTWQGLATPSGEPMEEPPAASAAAWDTSLRNLLRRFVSHDWLAERLGDGGSEGGCSETCDGP